MRWEKKGWKRDGWPANCSGSRCLICLLSKVAMMIMKLSIRWRGGKGKQEKLENVKTLRLNSSRPTAISSLGCELFLLHLPSLPSWCMNSFRTPTPAPPRPIPLLLLSRKFLLDRLCIESRANTGLLWLLWRKNVDGKICAMCFHTIMNLNSDHSSFWFYANNLWRKNSLPPPFTVSLR